MKEISLIYLSLKRRGGEKFRIHFINEQIVDLDGKTFEYNQTCNLKEQRNVDTLVLFGCACEFGLVFQNAI